MKMKIAKEKIDEIVGYVTPTYTVGSPDSYLIV